jgi:FkbM family methyltransferase
MRIGGRDLGAIATSVFNRCHYIAAGNMLRVYDNPIEGFSRYLFGLGKYPATILVNTSLGKQRLNVYSHHDVLTINEIFCRHDYPATNADHVIVDFGSNIGISAAYFLTTSPDSHAYLFEPLASNIDKLRLNLEPFDGRYTLHEVAVGLAEGEVEFGFEESGRYGGVGLKTGKYVSVKCLDSNRILENIVAKHGRIDILKIDIETLERQVTQRIPMEIAMKIQKIYVEYKFASNPLEQTHRMTQYASIAQFENRRGRS